jgi:lysophospholipase L1-like esterase
MWRLAPNVQIQTFVHYRAKDGELQPIQITINEDGYRGRKPTEVNGRKVARVLCLGDSNFFGYPLDDSQAFPQVLANAVTRELPQRPVEVINGGVPGYSTVQGRLWHARMFAHTERDVLLLSFLNNDAWPQPRTDDASLRWYGSAWYSVSVLIHHSQLVCWLERWIFAASAKSREVPRVPLDEFAQNYESFIREAGKAAVIIVDYRAYRQYEPYSQKLRELAREKGVTYVSVAELIEQEMKEGHALARYPELAKRVQGRWGGLLLQRPYLWYFAEYYPEHLNELGVALLADHMAPLVAAALESRN